MTTIRLTHGTITVRQCPHCRLVVQRNPPGAPDSMAAHIQLVHLEHYEAWLLLRAGPMSLPRRPGYQGRGGYDPAASLFPDLEGQPLSGWWTAAELAAAQAEAAESYAWWRAWNAEHPPDRTCHWCGRPGGKLWLSGGGIDGPRPCHEECANPAQPLTCTGAEK